MNSSIKALYTEIKRLDQLRKADKEAVAAALVAADAKAAASTLASKEAVNKAETAQANVNITQNEFRGSLKDQATTLMPRSEAENTTRELRGLITDLTIVVNGLRSRLDVGPPSLGALQAESDRRGGRDAGSGDTWKIVVGLAAIAVAAATVIVAIVR